MRRVGIRKYYEDEERPAKLGREKLDFLRRLTKMPMKTGDSDSYVIPSNVPAFLVKLWKLVEDPQYNEHISWNKVCLTSNALLW